MKQCIGAKVLTRDWSSSRYRCVYHLGSKPVSHKFGPRSHMQHQITDTKPTHTFNMRFPLHESLAPRKGERTMWLDQWVAHVLLDDHCLLAISADD